MSASFSDYQELFGAIESDPVVMARCACVACNSCTCACSCRAFPEQDEIEW
ncbi:FibroRumin family radical SAM-modified Cys-rich RiPP [Atopobium sp. oral taxon 810]|uniref:FibroRumin family radical SAM-modified Cys-rich RiPP n=1 Tax=Atopobium sp. oral taxon 810 TaxID=712158 RepID=UPI000397F603|nr:FibroRumin family radical SAM-modified Cys-rich RiPP [Atopobium sp. oral taxon 810]ERI04018.1 hypothetical protein HMPREF9069_01783 [Atopobium sp. oral taxon 810 str. F0209]DAW07912.1 MAG TPA: hypothetical protein [Caudoviricetes sp.]